MTKHDLNAKKNAPNYLLIGDGKISKHFLFYFNFLKLDIKQWSRRTNSLKDLKLKLEQATHVLLAVNDSSIQPVYLKIKKLNAVNFRNKIFIHFSGAMSFKGIFGAHPLMTFGQKLYPKADYFKIHFVIERSDLTHFNLNSILPGLKNSFSFVSPNEKNYYHALCVMGGNFPHILWKESSFKLLQMGVPLNVIHSYFKRNLNNFFLDPKNSLTGPLARKDSLTIKKHLKSFKNPAEKKLYKAFVAFKEESK